MELVDLLDLLRCRKFPKSFGILVNRNIVTLPVQLTTLVPLSGAVRLVFQRPSFQQFSLVGAQLLQAQGAGPGRVYVRRIGRRQAARGPGAAFGGCCHIPESGGV